MREINDFVSLKSNQLYQLFVLWIEESLWLLDFEFYYDILILLSLKVISKIIRVSFYFIYFLMIFHIFKHYKIIQGILLLLNNLPYV